jgi:hypothetical protein
MKQETRHIGSYAAIASKVQEHFGNISEWPQDSAVRLPNFVSRICQITECTTQ